MQPTYFIRRCLAIIVSIIAGTAGPSCFLAAASQSDEHSLTSIEFGEAR